MTGPITSQWAVAGALTVLGLLSAAVAIYQERRMQRGRLPGVSYAEATLRRDGGWRRDDLFTADGLAHQRQASKFGILAALLWLLALITFILLAPLTSVA